MLGWRHYLPVDLQIKENHSSSLAQTHSYSEMFLVGRYQRC